MPRFFLLVTKTRKGSGVPLGTRYDLVRDTIVGRSKRAGLTLDDRWLADEHALLRLAGSKVWLENQSRKTTWVNRLAIDGPAELRRGDHVQMGGVTMRVELREEGVEERCSTSIPTDPVLVVRADDAILFGHVIDVPRASLMALRAFALRPGEWLPSQEIAEEVWGRGWPRKIDGLGKCLGILRRACLTALDDEAIESLKAAMVDQMGRSSRRLDGMSPTQLIREFIKADRAQGFCLRLVVDRVAVI
jgi:hypothetical protein